MKSLDQTSEILKHEYNMNDEDNYVDELYDNNDNEDEENNEHRALILHLASQLSINMDISKLSLPACLCERRSILETYSDYFSNTALWLAIADFESPKDRMLACLKWYLSTFNASRKSKLAKKPYNPILGEVFKCKFKALNDSRATYVSYISEQVSHQPPILAFHVEDDLKKLSLSSQILLRSKFLGLSVSVDMVGQAKLTLLNREKETYIITFPRAFCNSIYTKPWLELGGKTKITCANSGYETIVNFKREGFIFGSRDRIEANVYHSGSKNAIYSVKGTWSGMIMIKENNSKKEEVFLDVTKISLIKAIVLPRSKQCEYESRKVWEDVTKHLKNKDINAATEDKNKVEIEQRNKANILWNLRHFHNNGNSYDFSHY